MKVIIDTNVLVSAIIRDNAPEQLILWLLSQPNIKWLATAGILTEYIEVLQRKKFALPIEVLNQWRNLFVNHITLVEAVIKFDFPRDQKDAKFLECALAGNADAFVTGDRDFSDAQALISAQIMTVAQFKVPDRGSVNPSPLGDRDKEAGLEWGHERLQARKPYDLGLQVPLGVGHEIPVRGAGW